MPCFVCAQIDVRSARDHQARLAAAAPVENRPAVQTQSDNLFGVRLRPAPVSTKSVWAPAVVREGPSNECSMVARRDGTLEIYFITKPASDSVTVIRSRDGGLTWSEPRIAFHLPGRAYYAIAILEAHDGALHAVYHIMGDGPGGYRGRLYEVWHTRQASGEAAWAEPRRVVPGYVGSINGFVQLAKSDRLVLAVARAIPERERPPAQAPDRGWNDTFVYFSDDGGATWRQSPDALSLELGTANVTRYGAIEPALLELRDGRLWMLVRDRGGRLWQSYSFSGGERWEPLARSPFVSSDSPADLFRLRNGKILLLTNACQNWSNPRSYAMGGREVLHAAISSDEGKSWRGFREILHEIPTTTARGDRGTSYASVVENADGKLVVVTGQGEGNRAILMFDPGWLEEDGASSDLSLGPVQWSQFGGGGMRVEQLADGRAALAIPLKSAAPRGALWNFPMADAGEITLRMQIPRTAGDVRLCLNDHFNRVDDTAAAEHAVFSLGLDPLIAREASGWHDVRLTWSNATETGDVTLAIDGKVAGRFTAQRRAQFGINYLRVEFRGPSGEDRVLLADVSSRRL